MTRSRIKLVLLESNSLIAESLIELLELKGYHVQWLKQPQDLVKQISEGRFDAQLLISEYYFHSDIPFEYVYTLMKNNTRCKDVPVIISSSMMSLEKCEFVEDNGLPELVKPYTMEQLYTIISEQLN